MGRKKYLPSLRRSSRHNSNDAAVETDDLAHAGETGELHRKRGSGSY